MKSYSYLLSLLALVLPVATKAQRLATSKLNQLPQVVITPEKTLHIISPEPIQYVDIASSRIRADLPLENIVRLKLAVDSADAEPGHSPFGELGPISIVGDNFIAQYNLQQGSERDEATAPTRINILPRDMAPLDIAGISLSQSQMKQKALEIISRNKPAKAVRKNASAGITMRLNGIYSITDYIFLDLSFTNRTTLKYDPDELRFFIQDKKITKATNVQTIELEPLFALHPLSAFSRSYRNIYVLKKVSFPGSKVLKISLTEQQISGRALELKVKYKNLLGADSL